jgi:hypothetical protein
MCIVSKKKIDSQLKLTIEKTLSGQNFSVSTSTAQKENKMKETISDET